KVIPVDRGDDDVAQAHALDGPGDPRRLERLGLTPRAAGRDRAVPARAPADPAHDLERRGAAAPALPDVPGPRLPPGRAQPALSHDALELGEPGVARGGTHLHPGGPLAGELRERHQTAAGSGSSATWKTFSYASRSGARSSSTVTVRSSSAASEVKSAPPRPHASNRS